MLRVMLLRAVDIARLKFRYLSVLPSSFAVTYASVTLPCIGRLSERLERPFFWIDAFACPALFSWHTGKSVSRDVIPKSSEFSPEHYATHGAYPAPFHKNGFAFLYPYCRSYEGRIGERQRDKDEPKILETTVGRVVPLLPVAPDRSYGELEASVERLFGEGGSGEQAEQGDFACGGHGVGIDVVMETSVEDVAPHLLAGAVQNAEVRGGVIPTFPFVSSFVSTTPEREGEDHTKLLAGANIAKAEVDYVVRTSMPIITIAITTTPIADPAAIAKEKLVGSSVFGADSPSAGGSHLIPGGFSDCSGSDSLVVVFGPGVCREMVDEFAPPKFSASVRGMDHDQLFTEFNVGAAHQISLSAEVRMRAKYNLKEKRMLNSVVKEKDSLLMSRLFIFVPKPLNLKLLRNHRDETQVLKERNSTLEKEKSKLEIQVTDLAASVKVREQEVANLDAVVTSVKLQNDSLADQDEKIEEVNEKFDKLCADFVDMALHLEEKFYPYLLTTISGRQWLITHGMELAIAKCLNFTEYLCTLGAAIGKAIEKGMHEGLSAGITHSAEGRKLTDVAAYNPSAEADYLSALQRLQSPHVDQRMVPIHHSSNQRVIGASALSLSLDVSSSRVRKIKENIANHVLDLRGVFVPLSEPLSAMALEGMEGTFGAAPDTTTALSITSVSASTISPISTDDYEVVYTDGQEGTGAGGETLNDESAVPFPNVSDAELDVLE
uniref:Transposase (Putative), gypsy type n=1 Tax=Tanacetum cinerariifolium TaxID=118510 RepID=A0A699H8B7_TANCI|nr:hypothetical protein [Tanacetum cinerariifolium]